MVDNYSVDDINDIYEISKQLGDNFKKTINLNKLPENEKIYIYKIGSECIGFIHFSILYETCDLLNIAIKETKKKKGIGTILIKKLVDNLPENVEKLMLEVNESNKIAINFYQKNGFKQISVRKNYYQTESALIMERNLK